MIRDRLVCGVNNDSIQKRLLTEGDKLSLTKAISIAQSYEMSEKDATELLTQDANSQPYTESSQHKLQEHRGKSATVVQKQDTGQVPVILRKNAVTIVIRLTISNVFVQHVQRAHLSGMYNCMVSESDITNTNSTTAVGHEYPLFTLTASQTPPVVILVKLNDKQIQMELDTGAAM